MSQKHQPFRRDAACVALAAALSFLAFSGVASAQLTKAKDHRFVFGHLHVHPTSAEAHKKFWVEILGGTLAHVGTMEAAMYPRRIDRMGVALLRRQRAGWRNQEHDGGPCGLHGS